jgi:Tfp pilus assembly protein PilX
MRTRERAVALLLVLATILIVMLLANIILTLVSSQSRLTHHQISRIQGYYAAMAGINYAYDKLRRGDDSVNWYLPTSSSYTRRLCNANPNCPYTTNCNINDSTLPCSISYVDIKVGPPGACPDSPTGIQACINATTTYTIP